MTLASMVVVSIGPTVGAAVGAYLGQMWSEPHMRRIVREVTAPMERQIRAIWHRIGEEPDAR